MPQELTGPDYERIGRAAHAALTSTSEKWYEGWTTGIGFLDGLVDIVAVTVGAVSELAAENISHAAGYLRETLASEYADDDARNAASMRFASATISSLLTTPHQKEDIVRAAYADREIAPNEEAPTFIPILTHGAVAQAETAPDPRVEAIKAAMHTTGEPQYPRREFTS